MPKSSQSLSNRQLIQLVSIVGIIITVLSIYYIKTHSHLFTIGGPFQSFIMNLGIFGPLIFILLQIIQVIYPIIPGGMTCVIGHAVFGPFYGFIYNFLGIFAGSLLSFCLARRYGDKFAKSFVSENTYDKYIAKLDKGRGFEFFLITAFVLPGFPDDFLCMVAGLSKMSLKKFCWITLLSKPATLYLYTLISYQSMLFINHTFL
ncbi:membrane-associated alkaline phosphatase [Streptococcus acidominimus]|uniref:TVP38/TMEM64 family membrane protein n=1 Tax=Streptococcus acidominimus TaxID=1326 RepID=A0A239X9V1_STRAI|nr:TVP38/TMEM64 family protein [Streptococcus acidominimus]SNV43170.1 membrane-associated alkaline phosphatase [Streptococcus acidominimus]